MLRVLQMRLPRCIFRRFIIRTKPRGRGVFFQQFSATGGAGNRKAFLASRKCAENRERLIEARSEHRKCPQEKIPSQLEGN